MKELVLDSKDSGTQAQRTCTQCGSNLGDKDFSCPNCGNNQQNVGQAFQRKVQDKGRQYNPWSANPQSNPMQFQKGVNLNRAASIQKESDVDDPKEKDVDPNLVPYESDEILQCVDPSEVIKRKKRRNVDECVDEVSKSCLDLAIDG